MRANEFINQESKQQVDEIAPLLVGLGGALARGAAGVAGKIAQGAAQIGKQAITSVGSSAASTLGTNIANKLSGTTQTTATNQTTTLQPNQLAQLKGRSVPTDLGQIKVGKINPQGLELDLDPKSKLGQILGSKLTVPVK